MFYIFPSSLRTVTIESGVTIVFGEAVVIKCKVGIA